MKQSAEAIERTPKGERSQVDKIALRTEPRSGSTSLGPNQEQFGSDRISIQTVKLNAVNLEAARVVSYDGTDNRTRPYDMLRTQVLREMDDRDWQVLAVISPTPRCGKTVIALNLALSVARQGDRDVILVDANLRTPEVARYLGLRGHVGLADVLQGSADLQDTLVKTEIASSTAFVLPSFAPVPNPSDLFGSGRVAALMQRLKQEFRHPIIILDTPPMLSVDDTLALLPVMDCVVVVVGIGQTTPSDLETCKEYLGETSVVRVISNRDRGA